MTPFHETESGRQFFDCQLPMLINALADIAAALKQPAPVYQLNRDIPEDVLEDLYYGNFAPSSEPDGTAVKAYVEDILQCQSKLKAAATREVWDLIEEYRTLLDRRGIAERDQAFAAGFRSATTLIAAGLTRPTKSAGSSQ